MRYVEFVRMKTYTDLDLLEEELEAQSQAKHAQRAAEDRVSALPYNKGLDQFYFDF